MPRKKGSKNKVVVLDASNIESVLEQQKKLAFPIKSSLKVLGKIYTAEGSTIQEAILNLKPELVKGVGILTLQKGNVKKEKVVRPQIINNLFGKYVSRVSREVAIKQISM